MSRIMDAEVAMHQHSGYHLVAEWDWGRVNRKTFICEITIELEVLCRQRRAGITLSLTSSAGPS